MGDMAPLPVIAVATFRNQTVNVRIPFKIPAKSMKNHNVTRSKILGFVHFKEHAGNNAGNRMKKARKQRSVLKEKITEIFINGEDTVSVLDVNQFKRHGGRAIHRILVTASRTETAVAEKRNELKFSAVWTAIHSATKRRITTVDHFFDIFHLRRSGMKSIFDFLIIVCKNSL